MEIILTEGTGNTEMEIILTEMEIILFDHFEYAEKLPKLLKEQFAELQEVSFLPSRDGVQRQFADVALPAFLMHFESPVPRGGSIRYSDRGNFMDVEIHVMGYLVLPWVASENPYVPDVNISHAVAAGICNIAAKIHSAAVGLKAGLPQMREIAFLDAEEVGNDYLIASVHWSHDAVVGTRKDDSIEVRQLFGRFLDCPSITREPKLVYEESG